MFFFFNDTATTEIYPLSLHDALPISLQHRQRSYWSGPGPDAVHRGHTRRCRGMARSEEHTSELQSQSNLVCRLLLEKKKIHQITVIISDTAKRESMRNVYSRSQLMTA